MALLTAQELAAELKLKPKKIRLLARSGKIPAERYGHEWRFDLEAVRRAAAYVDPIAASARMAARRVGVGGGVRGLGLRMMDRTGGRQS